MIEPSALTPRELYHLLISCVVPRPIALVTSVSPAGIINAAPFSFFNAVSANPPILMISVGRKKGLMKDTAANILATKEYVIHIVDEHSAEKMNITSASLSPDESEIIEAGFSVTPGTNVRVPRITESPISLECKLLHHLEVGNITSDLLLGEVVAFHIKEGLLKEGAVDAKMLLAIGRMGGSGYCRTRDLYEMERPK